MLPVVELVSSSEKPSRSFLLSSRIIFSFESSSVSLKLPHSKISISNIYRPLPPHSSRNLSLSSTMDLIISCLSQVTTPHEFLITGDINLHIDNPAENQISQFLSVLSSFDLTEHVAFPTHIQKPHSRPGNKLCGLCNFSEKSLSIYFVQCNQLHSFVNY